MEIGNSRDEDLKSFLQDGQRQYAPAFLAISEFRRQVSVKLKSVLDEFSTQLSSLGLAIDGLKLVKRPSLDDMDLTARFASIALEVNEDARFYTNYHVIWETSEGNENKARVGVWVWADKKDKRAALYRALQEKQTALKSSRLSRDPNGLSRLTLYFELESFHKLEEPFRELIEDWVEILTGIGGIRPYL